MPAGDGGAPAEEGGQAAQERKKGAAESVLEKHAERAKRAREAAEEKWRDLKHVTSVYISGLPDDATEDEIAKVNRGDRDFGPSRPLLMMTHECVRTMCSVNTAVHISGLPDDATEDEIAKVTRGAGEGCNAGIRVVWGFQYPWCFNQVRYMHCPPPGKVASWSPITSGDLLFACPWPWPARADVSLWVCQAALPSASHPRLLLHDATIVTCTLHCRYVQSLALTPSLARRCLPSAAS